MTNAARLPKAYCIHFVTQAQGSILRIQVEKIGMASAAWLATNLDQEMLEAGRNPAVVIAARPTPDGGLPRKNGGQVAAELGGRYLLRYLLPHQVGLYRHGSADPHCATPTPYAAADTVSWLKLPRARQDRPFVMFLDPAQISEIWGPRWVRFGKGIEYLLPRGFPQNAMVPVGSAWEVPVT